MNNSLLRYLSHETKPLGTNVQATMQIQPYDKIQSFLLDFRTSAGASATEAAIRAEVLNIRMTVDANEFINLSGAQLLDLYEFLGVRVSAPGSIAGMLELNIGRLAYVDPAIRNALGFGTNNVSNIQITVTMGTATTIASVQAFTAREPVRENLNNVCKALSYSVSFSGTGDSTYQNLPKDPSIIYTALMVNAGGGTITRGRVKLNSLLVRDDIPPVVNTQLLSNAGFAEVSGYYTHAFTDGQYTSGMPMAGVQDVILTHAFSVAPTAGSYNITALSINNLTV